MFSYDSKFSTIIRYCSDMLVTNVLILIFSLPIFTIGAAISAGYFTILEYQIRGRGYLISTFLGAFKKNLKQGVVIWSIGFLTIALFIFDIKYFYQRMVNGHADGPLYILFSVLLVLLTLFMVYIFAYLPRFTDSTRMTLRNAGILMLLHPRQSIKLAILLSIMVAGIYIQPLFILVFPALFLRTAVAILEKIFTRYMSEADLEREQEKNRVYTNTHQ